MNILTAQNRKQPSTLSPSHSSTSSATQSINITSSDSSNQPSSTSAIITVTSSSSVSHHSTTKHPECTSMVTENYVRPTEDVDITSSLNENATDAIVILMVVISVLSILFVTVLVVLIIVCLKYRRLYLVQKTWTHLH